jgi:D-aminopeptidase
MTNPQSFTASGAPRARGLGIPLPGTPGTNNAITDVTGVQVGYCTMIAGDGPLIVGAGPVRTGVTAILPRGKDGVGQPCAAGWYSLNGNGEMTGTTWIDEVGALTLPITISNTHAIGACHTGTVEWVNRHHPELARQWLLPVCAETWDGYLNDINGNHVRPEQVNLALDAASAGPIAEGSVGGGTGMNCYGFKGGSGTSSRQVRYGSATFTVAAFVQANFGSRSELTISGVPVGRELNVDNPMEATDWFSRDGQSVAAPAGAGSVIVVLATDAPLLPGQCKALARRAPLGLARTGTAGSHFSGDIFLAFSTANAGALRSAFPTAPASDEDFDSMRFIPWGRIDRFYTAAVQATEEAVLNALVVNQDMIGRDGHRSPALPHPELLAAMTAAGRLS